MTVSTADESPPDSSVLKTFAAYRPSMANISETCHNHQMRVLTCNVFGLGAPWDERHPIFSRVIAESNPDLISLQETVRTRELDQAADVIPPGFHIRHSSAREPTGRGIAIASRWPILRTEEVDLNVTNRTGDFACTSLIAEIDAPQPWGRTWLVNDFPDWQLDHARERELQAVRTARIIDSLVADSPGHVIIAGDLDASPNSSSIRFWTGRQSLENESACYRDAWASTHSPQDNGITFGTSNPLCRDWDWPHDRIDYVLVRCGQHGGPTLAIHECQRIFDTPDTTVSDHYGLITTLAQPDTA